MKRTWPTWAQTRRWLRDEADGVDRVMAAGGALAVLVMIAFAGLAAWDGAAGVRALTRGVGGVVTGATCVEETGARDPQVWTTGWNCAGAFEGDDGVRIERVRLYLHSDTPPGPAIDARVTGPDADWAWPDGEYEWVAAFFLAGLLLWLSYKGARFVVEDVSRS